MHKHTLTQTGIAHLRHVRVWQWFTHAGFAGTFLFFCFWLLLNDYVITRIHVKCTARIRVFPTSNTVTLKLISVWTTVWL